MKQPEINELVSFLKDFADPQLIALSKKYPAYPNLFIPGLTLGKDKYPENEEQKKQRIEELKIRAEICSIALKLVFEQCNSIMPKIKTKLKIFNNIQLVSIIIILFCAMALFKTENQNIKYVISGLTFLSGVLVLIVKHKSGSFFTDSKSLYKIHDILVDEKVKAEHYIQEIFILQKFESEDTLKNLSNIIEQGNKSVLTIRSVINTIL